MKKSKTKSTAPKQESAPATLEDLLGELHLASVKALLERVRSGEFLPADMKNVIELLKHNGIEASPVANPEMLDLLEETKNLPFPKEDAA